MIPDQYKLHHLKKRVGKYHKKTYNGYDQSEVISKLQQSIQKGLLVKSNYWAVELIISGYYEPLWRIILQIVMNQIVLTHKLINYVLKEYRYLTGIYHSDKQWIDRQEIRNHLAEIIGILAILPKRKLRKNLDKRGLSNALLQFRQALREHSKNLPYLIDRLEDHELKIACGIVCHGYPELWNLLDTQKNSSALRGYLIWLTQSLRPNGDELPLQKSEIIQSVMRINKIYRDLILFK